MYGILLGNCNNNDYVVLNLTNVALLLKNALYGC
jgi:hypothetical protein